MEQKNHHTKHHRRRRNPPPTRRRRTTTTNKIIVTNNKMKHTNKSLSLLAIVIVYCLLTLSFVCFGDQFLSPAQAQSRQSSSFLLPGNNLENFRILESQPVDSIVYQLKAVDKTNDKRRFSYHMTGDYFKVDELTGEIKLIKPLDRERQPQISVVVSVFDLNDSKVDIAVESKRRIIIVEDVDDSYPIFATNKYSVDPRTLSHQSLARTNTFNMKSNVYQVNLNELESIGHVVMNNLHVSDRDEGINSEILLECQPDKSTNSACDVFQIDLQREFTRLTDSEYSITIKTKRLLDYESVESYKLTLVARGRRPSILKGVPLETEAIILIDLINIQDEAPKFEDKPYNILMRESFKVGDRLLAIKVQDGDSEPRRDVSLIIAQSLFSEYFQLTKDPISNKIWYLETNSTIDRENPLISQSDNKITISVLAAELDGSGEALASEDELHKALMEPNYSRGQTISKENINIYILDLPDSKPIFYQASTGKLINNNVLMINISESIMSGSALPNLDLAIADIDQGANAKFNLTLLDSSIGPEASEAFALDYKVYYGKSTIVLKLINSSLIDYEIPHLRAYKFYLVATKNIDQPLSQSLEIHLNVMDANDNGPKFAQDQYEVFVPENSLPGTVIATITAQDKDSGLFGHVDYILSGSGASKFKLISNEGKIVVSDCGHLNCLDYEIQSSYSLIYEARDFGGRTENVSLIINILDINDNAPNFTEQVYKRKLISDNLSSNQNYISPQLIVRARDEDGPNNGNITYKVKSSNLTGLDVDPISGLVYLSQPFDLYETIFSGNSEMMNQMINSSSVSVQMKNKEIAFEAEIMAEDNGQPIRRNSTAKILLVVKDDREGAPKFKQDIYEVLVRENQPINKPFTQIRAIDPDDKDTQLRYSLAYDLNDLININSMTGELSFKSKVDFDDFNGIPYNITIFATDNSVPYPLKGSTMVRIIIQDVNNKAPKFISDDDDVDEYRATLIQGKTKIGETVLQVKAVDLDRNSKLEYSILLDKLVLTDRNGQQLTLNDIVLAQQRNNSAKLQNGEGYLAHMSKASRMKLVDNLKKLFKINKQTGAIELLNEPDYSFAASITIQIRVSDLNQEIFPLNGQEDIIACTFILQTQIGRLPVFAQSRSSFISSSSLDNTNETRSLTPTTNSANNNIDYNISIVEELPIGTVIFSFIATNPQTKSKIETFEKIHDSEQEDFFTVTKSGLVIVNKRLDFDEQQSLKIRNKKVFSLTVKAIIDDLLTSVTNLTINLLDLNDNAPEFEQQQYSATISESSIYPKDVLTVTAFDRDSNDFGQVYYSISGYSTGYFDIDQRRGIISVKKGVKLDRESDSKHVLFVTASDCPNNNKDDMSGRNEQQQQQQQYCKKSNVLVTIRLIDENDNDPQFKDLNQRGEFAEVITSEIVPIGTVLTKVFAQDLDDGANGRVNYEIVRGVESDLVSSLLEVDERGNIAVIKSLSGLGRAKPYRVMIRAYDHGLPSSRESYANLLLKIEDSVFNDGVPKFLKPKPDEILSLNENIGPSTFVYQVKAIDTDPDAYGRSIMYKFYQPSDYFEIDPFSGIIKTTKRANFQLDRELTPNLTLIIVANDVGVPPKQAFQALQIQLIDLNDNEPYFERSIDDPPIVIYVQEEIPKNSLVGTIQAIDRDIGQNALIGYEIISGNQKNLFRLDYGDDDMSNTTTDGTLSTSGVIGNNLCKIYSNERLDRETQESYTLTIVATSVSKLKSHFIRKFKNENENGFNGGSQYNASDLSKIRVTIKLLDIDDNPPVFVNQDQKNVVDFMAEISSELMRFEAIDLDSSTSEIRYSILNTIYYHDPKSRFNSHENNGAIYHHHAQHNQYGLTANRIEAVAKSNVFRIEPTTGVLSNLVSLRPYVDGYFEIWVQADSGKPAAVWQRNNRNGGEFPSLQEVTKNETEKIARTKAILFITKQKETFRLIFNKVKVEDRFNEFKLNVQQALERIMFESKGGRVTAPSQQLTSELSSNSVVRVAASTGASDSASLESSPHPSMLPGKAVKLFLNTFSMDFYRRDDGSQDFSTLTSCTQLIKFDSRSTLQTVPPLTAASAVAASPIPSSSSSSNYSLPNAIVPNAVMEYDEVIDLFEHLNATQYTRTLLSQYGLVKIERCLPEKAYSSFLNSMSSSERLSLLFACILALVSFLLAYVIVVFRCL